MDQTVRQRMLRVDPSQVTLGGPLGDVVERTWRGNLLRLDWERDFLAPFVEPAADNGYVGLGKTLEALSRFTAHTGEPALRALRERALAVLFAAQGRDGYLGTLRLASRVTQLWDVHELAYLTFALVTDWRLFDEPRSLLAARRLGDFLAREVGARPLDDIGAAGPCVVMATLGLDRAMLALYRETRDDRYLDMVLHVLELPNWPGRIVEGRHGRIEGHAYAFLTRALAMVELAALTGWENLAEPLDRAMDYLRGGGLVVTGTCSQSECWHSDQRGDGELGETCATAYLIRAADELLRWRGHGRYGDLIERTVYNALPAAQSPDGRRLRYYTPFEGERHYWERDTYCCPGNFRRIVGELPHLALYHRLNGLALSLYTPAVAQVPLREGLTVALTVETAFPNDGAVRIRLDPTLPTAFPLWLRIPGWCRSWTLRMNGVAAGGGFEDGFVRLERTWVAGDTVELDLDLPWRLLRGTGCQWGRVAVMRGPVVFAFDPAKNPGVDATALRLDPDTMHRVPDDSVRRGGQACAVEAVTATGERVLLRLTEFPDPDARQVYFGCTDPSVAEADELVPGT